MGQKVVGGWSWTENSPDFYYRSFHGTPVAGIAGALTNRNCSLLEPEGVAGVAGGWGPDENLGCQLLGFRIASREDESPEVSYILAAIREASSYNPNTGYGYGIHVLNNSYGTIDSAAYSESLCCAVLYAYENGVSFVASRGNNYNDRRIYPACCFYSKNISVGASRSNKNRVDFSSFGNGVDVLAPGAIGLTVSTDYEGGYLSFSGTSAAAPYITGVVALLRSEALDNGWNDLEPEDYEGMICASADDQTLEEDEFDDGGYLDGYDAKTGWGHLQADKIFDMLNEGYRVSHFSTNENLTIGDWEISRVHTFYQGGRYKKRLESGYYMGFVRKVSGSITLTNNWIIDSQHDLYVWQSSNHGLSGGYNAANPNFQDPYTVITSGTGGNDLTEGIHHGHSLTVEAYTYQYDLTAWPSMLYYGLQPPTGQIALNISVFGLVNPMLVQENKNENNPYKITIFPNPAVSTLNISIFSETPQQTTICIFDLFGRRIINEMNELYTNGINTKNIDISGLYSGSYVCRIIINGNVNSKMFTVLK